MADTSQSIALLEQRLAQAENRTEVQAKDIANLQRYTATLEGAMGQQDKSKGTMEAWGKIGAGIVFSLIMTFFGTFVLQRLDRQEISLHEMEVSNSEKFERKNQRILANRASINTANDKISGLKIPSTGTITTEIGTLKSEVGGMKATLANEQRDLNSLVSQMAQLNAITSQNKAGIAEHEEEIDALEEVFSEMFSSISSIKASTGAALVEVETQIRAENQVRNTERANLQVQIQSLWQKSYGEALPDNEFFSTDIPAKATTQVGKVNGG